MRELTTCDLIRDLDTKIYIQGELYQVNNILRGTRRRVQLMSLDGSQRFVVLDDEFFPHLKPMIVTEIEDPEYFL